MWTSLKLKTSGGSLREATTLPWILPPEVLLGSHDEDQRKIPSTLAMVREKVTILTYTQGKRTYFWNVPRAFSGTKANLALLQYEPAHHQHRAHHRQLPTQVMAWLELCIGKMLLALLYMKRRDRFLCRGYDIWPGKRKRRANAMILMNEEEVKRVWQMTECVYVYSTTDEMIRRENRKRKKNQWQQKDFNPV